MISNEKGIAAMELAKKILRQKLGWIFTYRHVSIIYFPKHYASDGSVIVIYMIHDKRKSIMIKRENILYGGTIYVKDGKIDDKSISNIPDPKHGKLPSLKDAKQMFIEYINKPDFKEKNLKKEELMDKYKDNNFRKEIIFLKDSKNFSWMLSFSKQIIAGRGIIDSFVIDEIDKKIYLNKDIDFMTADTIYFPDAAGPARA